MASICSSVSNKVPHTFVTREGSEYVAANGQTRIWQDCSGCGNVNTILAETLIRTCSDCGSTVSAPTYADAVTHALTYDLSCCDGIVPNPCDAYPLAWHGDCSGPFACTVAPWLTAADICAATTGHQWEPVAHPASAWSDAHTRMACVHCDASE